MSLKAELLTWAKALALYDGDEYEEALETFQGISESSKIQTNMGLIYAAMGEHEAAVESFNNATSLDRYLAVAYFQCGVSNFLLARYDLAFQDFQEAFLYLRENQSINYEQLGLNFRLYSAEILFNKGLTLIYTGRANEGLAILNEASTLKATDEHAVIDEAIQERGEGYTVFSIPVGVLFRPSQKKLGNLSAMDYLGKAKLIAATDSREEFTSFAGLSRQNTVKVSFAPEPPVNEVKLSRSATAPAPVVPKSADVTANVSRSRSANVAPAVQAPASAPALSRSTTFNLSGGLPARGLSIKRSDSSPRNKPAVAPRSNSPAVPVVETQQAELFDNDKLIESYGDDAYSAGTEPTPRQRNAAWGGAPVMRSGSRSAPGSSYGGGGGSLRRRPTKQSQQNWRGPSRMISSYEEEYEEEGYASGGDYEDDMFELVKIRVKLHYQDDTRGMTLDPEITFKEFMDKVATKFGKKSPDALSIRFKDEDGGKVSLRDDSDFDLAIETARESSKGKPEGKLEMWLADV